MKARSLASLILLAMIAGAHALSVGTARIDITPDEPIRLNGYGSRSRPSEGVAQRLHAKALAIGDAQPSVIITADIIGVSQGITDQVRERLRVSHGLPPQRVAICATHTHTGPTIKGLLEDIFMSALPADQAEAIDRYTQNFTDKLYQVAAAALDNRQPGQLAWGSGQVDFAINRRVLENGRWKGFGEVPSGPVDHSLPLLRVTDADDKLIALLVNYACHCTTLGGDFNQIHGDWAGRAAELIEAAHPNANALIAIGCGADANPKNRGAFAAIEPHARQLAREVERLLASPLKPLPDISTAKFNAINLPFDPLPSRDEWRELAARKDRWSYYGRKMLARLERGEELRRQLSYQIQTWQFGSELAMVFLPGEVVVDYSRRLKEIFRADRLWINAYANDAPCYIPSRRLYDEAGYEVDRNMWYYGHPTRLSKDTEELVVDEVIRQLPHGFYSPATLRQMPAPVDKSAALDTIRTRSDMRVELVAAEPLVMDPVDVAWGADGRMWVIEMADYPLGLDDHGQPGGRVRFLEDIDGDGIYDRSTLFAAGLNFPSSVMPWREGVLITAAPDILFAKDTNSDGRADQIEKLFTGFGEGNQQHRVNGLVWGLDNRVHAANGDSDGEIHSLRTGKRLNIRGRDFSFHPDTGALETEGGRTQHGRCRNDAGDWFGVNNSWPGWHVALAERYLQRNPHVSWPDVRAHLMSPPSAGPVFPASRTLNRLNDFSRVNRFTSACGSTIYRDDVLGGRFRGNYFVCEPVHNLVRGEIPAPAGSTFRSAKPADEDGMEFFASTDNWSRPVSVRTGPDGALYVVDMYRFLIEHPQWVPADWQRKLEFRTGSDKGRIYRILPQGRAPRPVPDLTRSNTAQIVETLASPNGTVRDLAHQLLLWREASDSVAALERVVNTSPSPHARLHALCVLDGLQNLDPKLLSRALRDDSPLVLRHAVRLAEALQDQPTIAAAYARLAGNLATDIQVRKQLAYSLGESSDPSAATSLLALALAEDADEYLISAVLSSARPHITELADALRNHRNPAEIPASLLTGLARTAAGEKNSGALHALASIAARSTPSLIALLEATAGWAFAEETQTLLAPHFARATDQAFTDSTALPERLAALQLLRHASDSIRPSLSQLRPLLAAIAPPDLQSTAAEAALRLHGRSSLQDAFVHWNTIGSAARGTVIQAALRRTDWTLSLLDWLADHRAALASLSAGDRVNLTTHRADEVRKRANELLGSTVSSDRQKLIADYTSAITLHGSFTAGRKLFEAACAVCHLPRDKRAALGPDLAGLSDYSTASLLTAILDPNRAVEDKFLAHTAITTDDLEITGMLLGETVHEVRLGDATGTIHTLPRKRLASLSSAGLSLMPEGFESAITPAAMNDLLAYIRSLATTRTVSAEADGSFQLLPGFASVSGSATVTDDAIVGLARGDAIRWTLDALPAGEYEIIAESAVATDYTGKPFHLTVGDIVADGIFETTRSLTRFRSRKFGNIRILRDLQRVEAILTHDLPGPQLSIKLLGLIPAR